MAGWELLIRRPRLSYLEKEEAFLANKRFTWSTFPANGCDPTSDDAKTSTVGQPSAVQYYTAA